MDSNCTSPLSSNGACSLAASNKSSIDESIDSKQDEIVIDEAINKQPKPPAAVKLKKSSKLKGSIEIKSRRSSLTTEAGSSKNPNFRARSGSWPSSDKEMKRRNVDYDTKLTIEINKELGIESGKQMKNPWGNLSYSQLIEKAIESSTWKSLTLKEIYAWFTKHVPYFKDKINYKSTMGWKNSIRHNLSLHKKFIRVGIYQWNNRYNRPSAKPIKYVWTSLTYKPKSLKSKAVMCEHNKLNHDSCCANRANQNICHNLNTFNANLQHLDANQLLCMYRILSNNDTLKEYLQNNINNGPPRDKPQTQNNQSFNEPENKYFGLNEMLNRQNPTTNTLVENYYKLLNTLTNQNTNIDFRNRLNMPVTPVQLFPVNNSNIPRFQMQNYPFIQLPIQTVPQGPKFFSYPNYSNLFLQKPTIYPNVTPQATMKARAQVDNTIPTPSQILLTSEMRNTNNESSVQANKHSSLLSTNCILEDDIQPPFKVSKTNSLNMFEKQLCDDDDLTKLEHSSLNEDNESDCKRDDCSNNSNSSDNSWNSSSSDDISSYNYKRKLMDRYITEDEYSHHKRMKTSHDMDNNNYNNNNNNHNSNNNNNNNNNNQLNSNNIHSHLSELLDSNNNNIRIHKAILKNH